MISDLLYDKIEELKNIYNLIAIKSEFEAEGSMFRDLVRLRGITRKTGVDLYLKISGVEALRDIKDAFELDVDGIIVPMIENSFSVKKFFQAYDKIYQGRKIFLTINIESTFGVGCLTNILSKCVDDHKNYISNMTIGRTDLTESFPIYHPVDSDETTKIVLESAKKIKDNGFIVTLGGSVSDETISIVKRNKKIREVFDRIETRKVVLPIESILKDGCLKSIFEFERLYILAKKEINDLFMDAEMKRLVELERRLK